MRLTQLQITNFKNYTQQLLDIDQTVNLIYGQNGSGKTNLLDAIYFISVAKSYFNLTDKQIIKESNQFYRVVGKLDSNGQAVEIIVKYELNGKKSIELQKKKLKKVSDLVGAISVVLVAPNDIKIVNQGSIERRKFIDRILCQCDSAYLNNLIAYNRILNQKNALLKGGYRPDPLLLKGYNEKLVFFGQEIYTARKEFVHSFLPLLQSLYKDISSAKERVGAEYISQFDTSDLVELYEHSLVDEIRFKRILIGTHKDDLSFMIDNKSLRKFGSQGQIKTFLYALRIAEFKYLESMLNQKPILILDDYFEKLDNNRLSSLIKLINNGTFDQVFLSDTELLRTQLLFEKNDIIFDSFKVNDGKVIKTL